MPKFVVSTTLEEPGVEQHDLLRRRRLAEDVGKLKEQFDGRHPSPAARPLVQALLARDLVDELHLMVFPVVLGPASASSPTAWTNLAEAASRRSRRETS